MPRPIRATIRAGALAHNLAAARAHAGAARVWAVVKANAYGHGLLRAARALAHADGFALLDLDEAVRLRAAGIDKPILLLEGFFAAEDLPLLAQHRLTPVIHSPEQLAALERHPETRIAEAYLKVNSGMNRLGFAGEQVRRAWQALRGRPGLERLTLMTHFADADGEGGVAAQLARFAALTRSLDAPRCLANSAALLRYPDTRADAVRPGIMLYGCSPFADRSAESLGLQPAMTLTSALIGVQRLRAGERVGYGFAFEATQPMSIGIVACGYADGYPRHAPTGTPVLVAGRRTRLVGRVSMDMITVDLTGIPEAAVGAPVTLWGEGLSADEVAQSAGTLGYEMLCALAPRVPVTEA